MIPKQFKIPRILGAHFPVAVRTVLLMLYARLDASAKYYACRHRVFRFLGHAIPWDPTRNAIHRAIAAALNLPKAFATWVAEQQATEKLLAQSPDYWSNLAFLITLFGADVMGDLMLLKSLGVEAGLRRMLMAFAIASVLFAIPYLAVKFAKQQSKVFFWVAVVLGLVMVAAIGIVQMNSAKSENGQASVFDLAGAVLLSIGVIGPAALAKIVMDAWIPVTKLRAERRRLIKLQKQARKIQARARRYVTTYQDYLHWYLGHLKRAVSVYKPAFARRFLKGGGTISTLDAMVAADEEAMWKEVKDIHLGLLPTTALPDTSDDDDQSPPPSGPATVPLFPNTNPLSQTLEPQANNAPRLQLVPAEPTNKGGTLHGKAGATIAELEQRLAKGLPVIPQNPYRSDS